MYNKNSLTEAIYTFLFGYDAHPGFEHIRDYNYAAENIVENILPKYVENEYKILEELQERIKSAVGPNLEAPTDSVLVGVKWVYDLIGMMLEEKKND